MRPTLPDTPVLRALQSMSRADLAAEVQAAQRFLRAAELYVSWAQTGEKLAAEFADLGRVAATAVPLFEVPAAPASEAHAPAADADAAYEHRPALRQAIRMVMSLEPTRVWKKSEIHAALKQRGWEPRSSKPGSPIATRLAEMIESGLVERVSTGYYRLRPEESDQTSTS